MSQLNVDNIQNRTGSSGGPNFPSGISVAVGQTAYIHGNLQVDGTETIINTETLNVADKTVGIGSTTNASNTTADGAGIEVFASSSQTGNNKTITWQNSSSAWTFGGGGIVATDAVVGSAVTINSSGVTVTGVVTATSFKGDGSLLTGIDATQIQNGNTSVQTVDTGSDGHVKMTTEGGERLRIGPAGQIGLGGANYGTSGQLLTSAGSGSAPTWTTVSSAPEVSGTANGAIAAGKPVISNADGSIGQVKYSYTELSPYQYTTYDTTITGYDMYWTKVGYDSTNNQFLYFYKSTQQSNAGKLNIGTPSGATTGTNVTIGSQQEITSAQVGDTGDIVWSKTSALGVAIYSSGAGVFVRAFTSDGTTITKGNELNINGGGGTGYITISWDEASDKFLVVCGDNSANSNYAEAHVISHSGTTLTKGSPVTVKTSQAKHVDLAYDSDNNRHLLTYADQSDSDKLCGRIITVSGTVPTVNAETKDTVTTVHTTRSTYIPGSSKFVTVYGRSNAGYARVVTVDGSNAITFGTESSSITSGISGSYGNMQLDTDYDAGLGKVIVAYVDNSTNASYVTATPDTSANTVTFGSRAYVRGGNGTSLDVSVAYSGYWQLNGFSAKRGTGGVNTVYWNLTTTSRATNVTDENYLGLSNSSYTNGQTASIRVSGSTQDNQTGLTPGQNYYVQNDGTLGLAAATPKVYAGTAVSSTKLLVGKETATPEPMWIKLASFSGSLDASADKQVIYEDFANQTYRRYKLVFYARGSGIPSNDCSDLGIQIKGSSGSWYTSNYRQIRISFRDNDERTDVTSYAYIAITRYQGTNFDGEYSFYDPADLDNNSPTDHMFGVKTYHQHSSQPGSNADCYQYDVHNGAWQGDGNQYVAGIRWHYGQAMGTFSWALFAANGWN